MQYLVQQKILSDPKASVTNTTLAELEQRDLANAGDKLAKQIGKPYSQMPSSGRVQGIMRDNVDRPSGKYAIIERAKDFTLVPWRDALEKRHGMDISGQIKNGRINWQLGKQKDMGIQ